MELTKSVIVIVGIKLIVFNVAPVIIQESSRFAMTYGFSKIYRYIFSSNDNTRTNRNYKDVLEIKQNLNFDDVIVVYKHQTQKYISDDIIVIET
jgi:hypothetical protein